MVQYKGSVSCSESLNSFSVYKKLQNCEKSTILRGFDVNGLCLDGIHSSFDFFFLGSLISTELQCA